MWRSADVGDEALRDHGRVVRCADAVPATVEVGTATLTFQSCTLATLDYTFTGGSSTGARAELR